VAIPRLEPGGAVIVIGARFAADDLGGRIIESEDGPNWKVVNLPALAGPDDPLGREVGEALWPERMGVDELEMRRTQMGTRAFDAQFQQSPVPAGGVLFKSEWFENRYDALPTLDTAQPVESGSSGSRPPRLLRVQSIDSAWKTGLSNDWSVIATLLNDERDTYVIDVWRGKAEYPDLRRAVIDEFAEHRPSIVYVEEAASGYAIVADLRRSTGIPIKSVRPTGSKIARAETVLPLFEAGRVRFPRSAPWLDAVLSEFLRFGSGGRHHDDAVDAIVLGVSMIKIRLGSTFSFGKIAARPVPAVGAAGFASLRPWAHW
jgi:predicted phage terminase large subunit-like protein